MIRVDAHTHFYPEHDLQRFLAAAWRNLLSSGQGSPTDHGRRPAGCIFLADTQDTAGFDRLVRAVAAGEAPGWSGVGPVGDRGFQLETPGGGRLFVLAARQIATAERLEVLAIGTRQPFGRIPLVAAVRDVAAAGAVPVIPWGAGKWSGRRRRLLEGLVAMPPDGIRLFLGDSGLRPAFLPRPRIFAIAAARGIFDLPGSDPLPAARHAERAGSCGFVIDMETGAATADSMLDHLRRLEVQPPTFGRRTGPAMFAIDQIAIRMKRRPADDRSESRAGAGRIHESGGR